MYYQFETQKAVQAAGVLLRAHRGRMSSLRLLKLLYIADRESLQRCGRPIIGVHPVAMDYGPLHSEVYNLIKGEHPAEEVWSHFIARDGQELELRGDVQVLELSRHDVRVLNDVAERYRNMNDWDIVSVTHEFPEWKAYHTPGSSRTIPLVAILEALDFSELDRSEISENFEEGERAERLKASQQVFFK